MSRREEHCRARDWNCYDPYGSVDEVRRSGGCAASSAGERPDGTIPWLVARVDTPKYPGASLNEVLSAVSLDAFAAFAATVEAERAALVANGETEWEMDPRWGGATIPTSTPLQNKLAQ